MTFKQQLFALILIMLFSFACQPEIETGNDEPAPSDAQPTEQSESNLEVAPEDTIEATPAVETQEPTSPPPTATVDEKFPPTSTPIPEKSELEEDSSMAEFSRDPQVSKAIKDLTGRMAITSDSIKILSVEDKTWPDSSLGCPQEGMMYMQMLVEGGKLIQLEVDGNVYNYHSGPNTDPFLCEQSKSDS